MTDLWMPGAVYVPCPTDKWGSYVAGPFRGVLHTTESDTYTPNRDTYYGHQFWPHFTIGEKIWQHIPINRAARALENRPGGVETNNRSAVQTEMVWRASKAASMPNGQMDRVALMMRWVESAVGVKRSAASFVRSPVPGRNEMSTQQWNVFNGWCGHQHVPEQSHTDPGLVDMAYLLGHQGEDDMTPDQDARLKNIEKFLGEHNTFIALHMDEFRADVDKRLTAIEKKIGV